MLAYGDTALIMRSVAKSYCKGVWVTVLPPFLFYKSKHIYRLPSLLISREAFCLQKIRSKFLARVRMIYVRRGGLLFLVTALSTICAKPKEYLVKYNLGRQWSMEEGRESCHRAVVTVGIIQNHWCSQDTEKFHHLEDPSWGHFITTPTSLPSSPLLSPLATTSLFFISEIFSLYINV